MNELNYATLEASRRLDEAGIVLETECYFKEFDGEITFVTKKERDFWLKEFRSGHAGFGATFIPAPSMAEVWRELPLQVVIGKRSDGETTAYSTRSEPYHSTNPTDALIDLLIWARKEAAQKSFKETQTMLKINGKPWYCECGGNVQTKIASNKYRCNSCQTVYEGE